MYHFSHVFFYRQCRKKNHILPYLMCRLWKLKLTCFMYNECCWCKCCFSLMSISRRLEHYKSSEVFEIDVSLKLFPLNPRVCVDLQNKFPSVLIETWWQITLYTMGTHPRDACFQRYLKVGFFQDWILWMNYLWPRTNYGGKKIPENCKMFKMYWYHKNWLCLL